METVKSMQLLFFLLERKIRNFTSVALFHLLPMEPEEKRNQDDPEGWRGEDEWDWTWFLLRSPSGTPLYPPIVLSAPSLKIKLFSKLYWTPIKEALNDQASTGLHNNYNNEKWHKSLLFLRVTSIIWHWKTQETGVFGRCTGLQKETMLEHLLSFVVVPLLQCLFSFMHTSRLSYLLAVRGISNVLRED